MGFFLPIAIRGGLSFLFGILLGIAGLFIARTFISGVSLSMDMLVWGSAVGAGLAGFMAWLKPEASWRITGLGFVLALGGAIVGSWVGFWYGGIAYPEGVRNVALVATGTLKSPAVWTFITGAAIFSTLFGAIFYGFRLWRYREV